MASAPANPPRSPLALAALVTKNRMGCWGAAAGAAGAGAAGCWANALDVRQIKAQAIRLCFNISSSLIV
jgi:hypothetical protein